MVTLNFNEHSGKYANIFLSQLYIIICAHHVLALSKKEKRNMKKKNCRLFYRFSSFIAFSYLAMKPNFNFSATYAELQTTL